MPARSISTKVALVAIVASAFAGAMIALWFMRPRPSVMATSPSVDAPKSPRITARPGARPTEIDAATESPAQIRLDAKPKKPAPRKKAEADEDVPAW